MVGIGQAASSRRVKRSVPTTAACWEIAFAPFGKPVRWRSRSHHAPCPGLPGARYAGHDQESPSCEGRRHNKMRRISSRKKGFPQPVPLMRRFNHRDLSDTEQIAEKLDRSSGRSVESEISVTDAGISLRMERRSQAVPSGSGREVTSNMTAADACHSARIVRKLDRRASASGCPRWPGWLASCCPALSNALRPRMSSTWALRIGWLPGCARDSIRYQSKCATIG